MNCAEALKNLDELARGALSGEKAKAVRTHLASCAHCSARLDASQWMEVLPALDVSIEPSPDFAARFREKVRTMPERRTGWLSGWTQPKKLAAAGALAAVLIAGIFIVRPPAVRQEGVELMTDLRVAENLPLLEDLPVIDNMDLLEDFDTIENLPSLMGEKGRRQTE